MRCTLDVNGTSHELKLPPERTLLGALRADLGLMGPREACGIGVCGSCTVLYLWETLAPRRWCASRSNYC